MTYAQLETIRSRNFLLDRLANLTGDSTSTSSLVYLLPPCLVFLAIDVVIRLSNRPTTMLVEVDDHDGRTVDLSRQQHSDNGTMIIRHLNHRAGRVLGGFNRLEANISAEMFRSQRLCRTLEKRRNFVHHRQRLEEHNLRGRRSGGAQNTLCDHERRNGVSKAFDNFCQRLLLQNRIWDQQKQIKALLGSVEAAQSRNSSSAFQGFCDRLLLSNQIWKLQAEVGRLTEEGEKLKKSRVAAVTRAAKQMVQDVRKERLTEEFVKGVLDEMEEHKRAILVLKGEHEREMAEMAEGWKGDYRRLCKEVERLQLAQDARVMEQELSNQVEQDLVERLMDLERRLNDRNDDRTTTMVEDDDSVTLSGLDDVDCDMSNVSMSTVVGSVGQCSPDNLKLAFDEGDNVLPKRRLKVKALSYRPSPLPLPTDDHWRRLKGRQRTISSLSSNTLVNDDVISTKPMKQRQGHSGDSSSSKEAYVGFSFNPLFYGNGTNKVVTIRKEDGSLKVVESPTIESCGGGDLACGMLRTQSVRAVNLDVIKAGRAPWRV